MKWTTLLLALASSPFIAKAIPTPDATTTSDAAEPTSTDAIIADAESDGIDLSSLSVSDEVLAELGDIIAANSSTARRLTRRANSNPPANAYRIDVHTHVVPSWYKTLVPTTGGNPTPDWTMEQHLDFMDTYQIKKSVFAFSAPGSGITLGNSATSVVLARVMNLWLWGQSVLYPARVAWYAVVPLTDVNAAITEAKYALDTLGAAGIVVLSNHDGKYLGNTAFKAFFQYINSRGGKQIIYVHPNTPYLKVGNQWVEANPTLYSTGLIEFYFETARTLMDLTVTQTVANFTNINWVIPHVGGSFPSVLDRFIKSFPAIETAAKTAFQTRFFWDSAGPTYPSQVQGLLGYGIPDTQLLFGTDYPYAPAVAYAGGILGINNTQSAARQQALFVNNPTRLFAGKVTF